MEFPAFDSQNYLVFQPVFKYSKKIVNSNHISNCKSEGLSDKIIKPPASSNNSHAPALNHINTKLRVKVYGHCLKQDEEKFTYK